MKILILFRGLPSAGKTTLANLLCDFVYSADDYFYIDGEYKFDASKLREAHQSCQKSVAEAMSEDVCLIGVANTNSQPWEMKTYEDLAHKYGYQVHYIIVENRRGKAEDTNQHNVPAETIQKMRDRFDVSLG